MQYADESNTSDEDDNIRFDGSVTPGENGNATFKTPDKEGAYRLFVYIMDGNNNVATANVPFYIKR